MPRINYDPEPPNENEAKIQSTLSGIQDNVLQLINDQAKLDHATDAVQQLQQNLQTALESFMEIDPKKIGTEDQKLIEALQMDIKELVNDPSKLQKTRDDLGQIQGELDRIYSAHLPADASNDDRASRIQAGERLEQVITPASTLAKAVDEFNSETKTDVEQNTTSPFDLSHLIGDVFKNENGSYQKGKFNTKLDEFREMVKNAETLNVDVRFAEYKDSKVLRDAMEVSGKEMQAAHLVQQFLSKLNDDIISKHEALAVLLPPATHKIFDQFWKKELNELRKDEIGKQNITVGDWIQKTADGWENKVNQELTKEKQALITAGNNTEAEKYKEFSKEQLSTIIWAFTDDLLRRSNQSLKGILPIDQPDAIKKQFENLKNDLREGLSPKEAINRIRELAKPEELAKIQERIKELYKEMMGKEMEDEFMQ